MANILYFNLERFANVIVGTPSVPLGTSLHNLHQLNDRLPFVVLQRCR
jgi:hypothetical protein